MKIRLLILMVFAAVILNGCGGDKEDMDYDLPDSEYPAYVSKETFEAFYRLFPGARNVEWNMREDYRVARFNLPVSRAAGTSDHTAWFDNRGNWYMTETEILFDMLPEPVKAAFRNSEYAEWTITDIDQLLRERTEIVYIIEVQSIQNGIETEMDLYYSQDGILIKKVVDVEDDYDYNDYIPSQPGDGIEAFIKQRYPGARIFEIDKENGMTEIEILDGKKCRELLFDSSNSWIHTKTEMSFNELPEKIRAAFSSSRYAGYRIDDIDFYETPSKNFYRFDLKSIDGDTKIEINEDGTVSVPEYNPSVPGQGGDQGNGNMADKTIQDFIYEKYRGAYIVEFDYEDGMIEVEIIHENREKNVYFNGAKKWVMTKWDLRQSELPASVKDVIRSQYAGYELDDAEYVQTPSGDYYIVELERGKQEIKLRINPDGTIVPTDYRDK